ncbi:MAG TPA: protein kinase [Cellulomonas sp.]|uniref:protein kinase domain-containing protein n=1 Tax=Cellulomonas sp. TaxID=40001 RepID=UPI002E36FA0C|nr:protein kinase [Cellulomonas sp.]HEX5332705.1 protein kinase [Cellulomonas sp.]
MEPSAAPPDVVAALLTGGYRVLGPIGRGAQGPAWSAVALDGPPERVVVRVVDLAADPRHGARLDRLRNVQHEHLARVRDVVAVRPGTAALLVDHVAGPTLAALRSARGPLSAGEAVTLAVPLADALEALHAAGLVHGDVSPANIVIGLDGRPVLVDLLGALTPSAGTPGFAAPEVRRGEACEPPGDVYALASVVLAQLGPAPTGRGAGADLTASSDAQRVRDLLTAATDPDPRLRLAARELADACFRAHAPEPILLPDSSVLARTELAGLASRGGRTPTVRRTSRHRGRRTWRAHLSRAAAAVGAVVVCGVLVFAVGQRGAAEAGGHDPGEDTGTTYVALTRVPGAPDLSAIGLLHGGRASSALAARSTAPVAPTEAAGRASADPVVEARRLTELRADVISAGDAGALASVEVLGSPAHTADAAILADLAARGLRIEGLSVAVTGVELVATAGTQAKVAVTSATSGYRLLRADGTTESTVPAGRQRTVVLQLEPASDGLRVTDVLTPDATGGGV